MLPPTGRCHTSIPPTATIELHTPLFRARRRLRIAVAGLPGAGKSTLFRAIESTSATRDASAIGRRTIGECDIDIGLDQAHVVDVADARSLHEGELPDVIIQVIDAVALERHLELTLDLLKLGRPLVIALNKIDEARDQGMHTGTLALSRRLGVAVVPTVASMGYGIAQVFTAATRAARRRTSGMELRVGDTVAERRRVAAMLAEVARRPAGVRSRRDWRYWLDELFLSPRWGILGSALVFALVLFFVFDVSAWLDTLTSARLAQALSAWHPVTTEAVVARAIADALVGLVGIVVPYMIPLVLLLIVLEQVGIMSRIAFALDRGFHRLGLHGGVALPFLLGLGCNVPALSAISDRTRGGERVVASVLVTFVPCSARSAIVLALAGKYLGVWGVLAVFGAALVVIAAMGLLLRRKAADRPGQIHEIPPYALPRWRPLVKETWIRTKDILTIVTPLLVAGSVVLALLQHIGADDAINALLAPVTHSWLGLPVVLGVPLLFGVLRKELSLLMIFQALGTFEIGALLGWVQILTFLLFITLYVPCISTFAVMLKTIGRRQALYSVALSIGVALAASGAVRFALQAFA